MIYCSLVMFVIITQIHRLTSSEYAYNHNTFNNCSSSMVGTHSRSTCPRLSWHALVSPAAARARVVARRAAARRPRDRDATYT